MAVSKFEFLQKYYEFSIENHCTHDEFFKKTVTHLVKLGQVTQGEVDKFKEYKDVEHKVNLKKKEIDKAQENLADLREELETLEREAGRYKITIGGIVVEEHEPRISPPDPCGGGRNFRSHC